MDRSGTNEQKKGELERAKFSTQRRRDRGEVRIGLRRNPVVRDRLFTAVLAGGFLHEFLFCNY
ncbi:hypothetical protein EJ110_NYTH48970 [Nymphaea thermarum]|nr:hypothetical protein EJ110_NYTH48970 [Nymphaea thermarum]